MTGDEEQLAQNVQDWLRLPAANAETFICETLKLVDALGGFDRAEKFLQLQLAIVRLERSFNNA